MKLFIAFNLLILAIIVVRSIVDGRISRKMQYATWILLPIFLIISSLVSIPVTIKVSYRTERALNYASYNQLTTNNLEKEANRTPLVVTKPSATTTTVVDTPVTETTVVSPSQNTSPLTPNEPAPSGTDPYKVALVVYVCGASFLALMVVGNNVAFAIKTRRTREFYTVVSERKIPVYKLKGIKSPFLHGRSIYIPSFMHESDSSYKFAVAHEYCHYTQGDSVWPIVEYVFLVLLWFDPLMWIAHVLIQRDSEMAVDEKVIDLFGQKMRRNYSQTLLDYLSAISTYDGFFAASTSMNGKSSSFIKCRVKNIMKGSRKSVSATLAVAIFMAGIVGCSVLNPTPKSEAKYITENTPWWNDSIVEYPLNQVADDFSALANNVLYSDETCYVQSFVDVSGNNECNSFCKFAYDGSYFYSINLNDLFGAEKAYDMWGYCYYQHNAKEYIMFNRYNEDIEDNESVTYEIDWANGQLINEVVLDKSNMPIGSIDAVFSSDNAVDYLIIDDSSIGTSKLKYYIYKDSGDDYSIEELSYSENDSAITMSDFSVVGDEVCLCLDIGNSSQHKYENKCIKYNVSTGDYSEYDLPSGIFTVLNNEFYYQAGNGIGKVSLDSGEIEDFIYYEDTYINKEFVNGNIFKILWISENKIVLSCEQGGVVVANGVDVVITLTLADTNPNIGKALLTLAHIDVLPDNIYKAVNKFNRENGEIYIAVTDDYYVYPKLDDEYTQVDYMSTCRSLLDQLMVDINSGAGPDLIMLDSHTAQLNDSKYLTGLKSYIDDDSDIKNAEYVADIFKDEDGDGEIYKLPFAVSYNAITVKREYSDGYDASLTYDEYEKFISDNSLGNIYCGDRIATFDALFIASANQFFDSDNNLTINNDSFREMAEFAKGMPEIESLYGYESLPRIGNYASYSTWMTVIGGMYENYDIMAIPSANKQGVTASTIGIGIVACCPLENEAWEFSRSLLSIDVQSSGFGDGMPVNRKAFDNYSHTIVDEFNNWLPSWSVIGTLNPAMSDYFLDCLGEVTIQRDVDSGVLSIINEELQAYFADQKSIDQVIEIIENRVKTMVDERG